AVEIVEIVGARGREQANEADGYASCALEDGDEPLHIRQHSASEYGMLTRRGLLTGFAAFGLAAPARAEPVLTEDGLYRQPWFLESFLELADDLQGAANTGKRFAIMWELRGCPYCRETHLVNFARPDVE